MNNNKFVLAAIAGSISFFLLGMLIYGAILSNYLASHSGLDSETMEKVMKPTNQMVWWASILSNVAAGILITAILQWASIKSFGAGLRVGAIAGLLIAAAVDFGFLSFSNIYSIQSAFADMAAGTVMMSITGGVVAWVLGRHVEPQVQVK